MSSDWVRAVCAGTLALFVADVANAQAGSGIDPQALRQIAVLQQDKARRTPAQRKMDARLIFAVKRQRRDPLIARMPGLLQSLETREAGAAHVEHGAAAQIEHGAAHIEVSGRITPALERHIGELGGALERSDPAASSLRAWVPLQALESLAARPEVRSLAPAEPLHTRAVSEGDRTHLTDVARGLFGVDGRGTKICVISDGVEQLASLQAQGELPAVDVLPFQQGAGSEGTAMLEIIHDLAPGAALGFATARGGQGAFAANIAALRDAGCDVLVDDASYLDEPVFQDGIVAQTIAAVVRTPRPAGPVVYVSAAGNDGGLSRGTASVWEGDFRGVARTVGVDPMLANDFGGGVTENVLVRDSLAVVLSWSDPLGASRNDYDLFLLDASGRNVIDFSNGFQDGTQNPFEIIPSFLRDDTNRRLVIARFSGENRFLRLHAFFGGVLSSGTRGASFGHAASEDVISVASAAAGSDPADPFPLSAGVVERLSSDGPRRVFFLPDGTPLTPGNFSSTGGRLIAKPDIVGASGVATSTASFERFFGTSAAAAHVAAIAGLVLSASDSAPSPSPGLVRLRAASTMKGILQGGGIRRTSVAAGVFDEGAGVLSGLAVVQGAAAALPCFDGVDNDGDGRADLFIDPGCASLASPTESPVCDDRADNDGDGLVDLADRGCSNAADGDECGSGALQSLAVLPILAYLARRRRARP
jgi:hypothetical protein